MDRHEQLRGRTTAAIEQGDGDTDQLATEWAMPFIPDDGGNSPTDVPFSGGRGPRRPVSGFVVFSGRLMMIFGLVVSLSGVFAGVHMLGETVPRTLAPKVVAVTGVPTVRIENTVGDVRVVAGGGDKVEVRARVTAQHISRGLAERAVAEYEIDAAPNDQGVIVINTREGSPFDGGDILAFWWMHRSVNLTVTMPANGNLDLNVSAGSTTIEGITGRINAQVHAGTLNLSGVRLADGSSFKVNAGGLNFSGELQTDASITLDVNAGNADLVLPKWTAAKLVATTDAGSVQASGWPNILPELPNAGGMRLDGYLTADTNTKSVIAVTVNAGSVGIIGRNAPSAPSPPAPPAPPARP